MEVQNVIRGNYRSYQEDLGGQFDSMNTKRAFLSWYVIYWSSQYLEQTSWNYWDAPRSSIALKTAPLEETDDGALSAEELGETDRLGGGTDDAVLAHP